ncbi:MAG: hypothetical protein BWY09_00175 [Candidatus Hydrogenedentes bacterium ADurb.Bin179]|nr:MAG: hypothetical protein BWY09_00175 [Candidatus Hydrogenedentes bacterium ADurb.Bin179]
MCFCKRLLSFVFGRRPNDIPFIIKPMDENGREVGGTLVSHNLDHLSEDERAAFIEAASEFTEIPLFDGHVEYGYSLEGVADETRCPRCGGSAALRYANFIYMSQKAMRVMYVPAGFFCTQCPTVSVNEDIIRVGVADKRHQYKQVVGIDYGGKKDADNFRKWNGKSLVYYLMRTGIYWILRQRRNIAMCPWRCHPGGINRPGTNGKGSKKMRAKETGASDRQHTPVLSQVAFYQ